jgi:hypothetical protein
VSLEGTIPGESCRTLDLVSTTSLNNYCGNFTNVKTKMKSHSERVQNPVVLRFKTLTHTHTHTHTHSVEIVKELNA